MADEKTETKRTAVSLFREKLQNRGSLKDTVLEGLKSTNARVRSLAIKTAFKLKDHELVKKNVLPLIHSDKSKKVLRTVSNKITRKALAKRVHGLLAKKNVAGKKAETTPAAPAPAAAAKE